MGNYKIKVENNVDDLVELFSSMGCKYFSHTVSIKNYMIYQNGKCFFVKSKKDFNMYDCKEINIEQLRDLVVLRREKVEVEKVDTDKMLADVEVQISTHSQHSHYFKDVRDLNVIDVYQVLRLFNVTDPCLQHIIKKALVVGGRGHKDFERDLKDIHDTSKRALEINNILH